MLRQALLITLAAGGLSACSWGYGNGYGYSVPPSPAYGPILYQGTQWSSPWSGGWGSSWGSGWAMPWTNPWGTQWGNPWASGQWGQQWSATTSSSSSSTSASSGYRQPYVGELSGPGVPVLDEWLRDTPEGRAIVTMGFRDAAEGEISEEVAQRANLWFCHYADFNRDMTLTDDEIRTGLVSAARPYPTQAPAPPPADQPGG